MHNPHINFHNLKANLADAEQFIHTDKTTQAICFFLMYQEVIHKWLAPKIINHYVLTLQGAIW